MSGATVVPGVPRRTWGIRIRRTQDGLTLGIADQAILLDGVAQEVYTALDGRTTVEQIADAIAAKHGIERGEVLGDVVDLLEQLGQVGVVDWVE